MALKAEDARLGKCGGAIGCQGDAILTTKVKMKDGEYEYNAFCIGCLDMAAEYVAEKAKELQ